MAFHHGGVACALAIPYGISGGQSAAQTGSASSTSVFTLSCHSTSVLLVLLFVLVYTLYLKCWDELLE
jgi:hypothetical protein